MLINAVLAIKNTGPLPPPTAATPPPILGNIKNTVGKKIPLNFSIWQANTGDAIGARGLAMVKQDKDRDDDVIVINPRRPVRREFPSNVEVGPLIKRWRLEKAHEQESLNNAVAAEQRLAQQVSVAPLAANREGNDEDGAISTNETEQTRDLEDDSTASIAGNDQSNSLNMMAVRQEPERDETNTAVIVQEHDETAAAVDALGKEPGT